MYPSLRQYIIRLYFINCDNKTVDYAQMYVTFKFFLILPIFPKPSLSRVKLALDRFFFYFIVSSDFLQLIVLIKSCCWLLTSSLG